MKHPSEYIREELAKRNWPQADFAWILGKSPMFVSRIVNGKTKITVNTASLLSAAFGDDPAEWMRRQNAWDLYQLDAAKKAGKCAVVVCPRCSGKGYVRRAK